MPLINRLWRRYLQITDAYPIRVQALTGLIFAAAGNFISQTIVEKRSIWNIDWGSMFRFTAIAVFITFPIVRSWLWVLENYVKPGKFAPLRRVLLDQLVFAPLNYAFFLILIGFIEGNGWNSASRRLRNDYIGVMLNNYKVWPAAQLINFYFVPFNQRILYGSVLSLFWNTYLAYVVRVPGNDTGGKMGTHTA